MKKTWKKALSGILACVFAGSMALTAAAESRTYSFYTYNFGGNSPYRQLTTSSGDAVDVWINGGKVTLPNGAVYDHKNIMTSLFLTEDGRVYDYTKAKGLIWGASTSATRPALENGRYKNTTAKDIVKINNTGKLTPGKTPGNAFVHVYHVLKVGRNTTITDIGSFATKTKVAPSAIDVYGTNEYSKKITKLDVPFNSSGVLYTKPIAGSTRAPLAVDAGTTYSVTATKGGEYVSFCATSSGNYSSSLELTYEQLMNGFYIHGDATKTETTNGVATVTIMCLNNGKKKNINVNVLKPPMNTTAAYIDLELKDGTNSGKKYRYVFDESGTTSSGDITSIDKIGSSDTTFNFDMGDSKKVTITVTPKSTSPSVSFSGTSIKGETVGKQTTVTVSRASAISSISIKHGSDNTIYNFNLSTSASDLVGVVPDKIELKNGSTSLGTLTDVESLKFANSGAVNVSMDMQNQTAASLDITIPSGVKPIFSGTASDGEVLITAIPTNQNQTITMSNLSVKDNVVSVPLTLTGPSAQFAVNLSTTTLKSKLTVTVTTNSFVNSYIQYMYVGGSQSTNFTKTNNSSGSILNLAEYEAVAKSRNNTAAYTQNQQIRLAILDNSKFDLTYAALDNCNITDDGKFSALNVNSKSQATFVVTVTPTNPNATDIKTEKTAEKTRYHVTVKW